ncbi:shTK domain protein [Ostertagia ostertagi]
MPRNPCHGQPIVVVDPSALNPPVDPPPAEIVCVFIASATACDDNYSGAACAALFGTAVVAGGTTDRDALCLTDADVKEIAISSCPKHCGFCCMTPEYQCSNVDFPRVRCSTITPAQCRDPTWRTIIAEDCPNVCGFCLEGGCVDAVIECENDPSICRNVDMQNFVRTNCMRTCGYCSSSSTVAGSVTTVASGTGCSTAVDAHPSCANWVRNGFCNSAFYTAADKRTHCARSCNLC